MAKRKENTKNFAPLGRKINWIETRKDALLIGFAVLCAVLFLLDFFYKKKTYTEVETIIGAYPIAGFIAMLITIVTARLWQLIVKRPVDYYGARDVQGEPHPKADLEALKRGAS